MPENVITNNPYKDFLNSDLIFCTPYMRHSH